MANVNEMLDEEIANQLEKMKYLVHGSPEHQAAAKAVSELYKARSEGRRVELQHQEAVERQESDERKHDEELEFRQKEDERAAETLKAEKRSRIVNTVLDVAKGILLPAGMFLIGLGFEKTGAITSYFNKQTFSGLFKRK